MIKPDTPKWKIAEDILHRYTGTAPESYKPQIVLTKAPLVEQTA